MKSIRVIFIVMVLAIAITALVAGSGRRAQAQVTVQGTIPDQATINVILSSMNAERDSAEILIKRDTEIVVDILPLKWSPTLARIAEDRVKSTLRIYGDATRHITLEQEAEKIRPDLGRPENLLPYGIRKSNPNSKAYPAADLVKGWSGIKDSCTAAEWAANVYQACGEKAANSFVAINKAAGTYKRHCNNTRVSSCGHYGNIIEKNWKSVGCARAETPHKTDADITNGGWSCVFSQAEVQE